ncbi:hypothetical protein D3C81_1350590 [compost metagenome]
MAVAFRTGHHARVRGLVDDALAHGQHGIRHRHVDELALAGFLHAVNGRQDADAEHQRRDRVTHAGADLHRRAAVRPGDAHHAAHGLRDHVIGGPPRIGAGARARVAEAAHGAVDQARIRFAQRFVSQSEPLHHAGAEVLDDDVGTIDQLAHNADALGRLQVHGNRTLVAIDALEIAAVVAQRVVFTERAGEARAVAGHGFDLDDVGAVVGQDLRAERAGEHLREVDDAQAGQRTRGLRPGGHAATLPMMASEMMRIWISEVPSKILVRRASRQ